MIELAFLPPIVFVFGTLVGSFLNVVILRYLNGKSIAADRSACPHCDRILRWWELMPIISYAILQGRCARCKHPISAQYPIVEFATGLSFLILGSQVMYHDLNPYLAVIYAAAVALLIVLFVIDLYTMLLPDIFVALLTAVAIVAVVVGLFQIENLKFQISSSILGVVIGAGFLLFLYLITRGRGIGFGDVKLMIPLGLIFGGWGTVILLLLSFISGGLVSIMLLARGQAHMKTAIPFGPFIAGSAILLLLFPVLISEMRFWLWPY